MSKEIKIKSNGLRNELKEIRKSIDKLTNAILLAQTHKHEDINFNYANDVLDDIIERKRKNGTMPEDLPSYKDVGRQWNDITNSSTEDVA